MCRRYALIGMAATWAWAAGAQDAAVFRSDADAVTVNVSAKEGNAPVQGLTARDFRLYDNDVRQNVEVISLDAVPVDVSFVVDTSGSAFADLEAARNAVRGMARFLRPSDRFRVLTMGNAVMNAVPWQDAARALDTAAIYLVGGQISLVADAVFMALFHRTSPDRRHLVVALTDGEDWCSLISGDALSKGAERSGAVLHWINVRKTAGDVVQLKSGDRRPQMSEGVHAYCRVTNRGASLQPSLTDAVRVTGGTVQAALYGADRVAVEAFDRILDDFRRSYVLHYVPRGVERTGWHRLRVEMSEKGYTVRARSGYWADAATTQAR